MDVKADDDDDDDEVSALNCEAHFLEPFPFSTHFLQLTPSDPSASSLPISS